MSAPRDFLSAERDVAIIGRRLRFLRVLVDPIITESPYDK